MLRNKRANGGPFIILIILVILIVSILLLRGDIPFTQDQAEEEADEEEDIFVPSSDDDDDDGSSGDDDNGGSSSSDRADYFGANADLIHLVLGNTPDDEITIIWVTGEDGEDNSTVLYHKEGVGVNSTAVGTSTRLDDSDDYVHVVELTGLDADSIYSFYCSGVAEYSDERLFKTTGTILGNYTVITDTQSLGDEFENVSIEMASENPEFVLHCGDHVSNSDEMDEWIEYFEIIEETWVTDSGITIAIAPSLGNHDDSSPWFWQFFDLTDNAEWQKYIWDNHVLVTLNSVDDNLVDDQVVFLTDAVDDGKNLTVAFHHNIYESPIKSEQDEIVEFWVPVFEEYNVTLIIHGHEHRYYRSAVTNNVTYVCAGAGGGSPRNELPPDSLTIEAWDDRYCYVLVDIEANLLSATDIDGTLFDSNAIY